MKKMILVLAVLVFSSALFASELNNRSFTGPQEVVKALTSSYSELVNPYCITKYIRQGENLDLYFLAGYVVSSIETRDTILSVGEAHLPVVHVVVRLDEFRNYKSTLVEFDCKLK